MSCIATRKAEARACITCIGPPLITMPRPSKEPENAPARCDGGYKASPDCMAENLNGALSCNVSFGRKCGFAGQAQHKNSVAVML